MASSSPAKHPDSLLPPSPLPTRRTRTLSTSERARQGATVHGICQSFDRNKGHGFIKPDGEDALLFVHISDIDTPYVLLEGDRVSFKKCAVPPKCEQMQAVHVLISEEDISLKARETWQS
ncbi:calcium-regulated heat-stable protein 1-like [Sycon ciliatum]|uniref:calcium-regulated heat-stable protein 1-like n=1 Tax=Sycon ciliatum TaxID=27933 RepID=UPI0020AE30D6|eukprot:scpid19255/ scgid32962/ Calcium-regulated heat stable protein 1; Calcium-regulated heat-stable protein of 24 kDa